MPAEQVHALAAETLTEHFPLGVEGYRYEDAGIFNVVIATAAQERSIDIFCLNIPRIVQAPDIRLLGQPSLCPQEPNGYRAHSA